MSGVVILFAFTMSRVIIFAEKMINTPSQTTGDSEALQALPADTAE